MSGVILTGATSGTITVEPTAIAGSNTLTLPAETGTLRSTVSSGEVVTRAYVENTAYSSSAATIPADDSIPQIGEGAQILSLAIAVKSATNKVRATVTGSLATPTGPDSGNVALFVNGGANAIHAVPFTTTNAHYMLPISFVFEHTPGSVATHTYTVRAGVATYTTYVNGSASGRLSGGVARWAMTLEEIVP